MGIAQTEISRIENGTRNPSLKILQWLADGMGMVLKVSFEPKKKSPGTMNKEVKRQTRP